MRGWEGLSVGLEEGYEVVGNQICGLPWWLTLLEMVVLQRYSGITGVVGSSVLR